MSTYWPLLARKAPPRRDWQFLAGCRKSNFNDSCL
jgi:hypothetical protein